MVATNDHARRLLFLYRQTNLTRDCAPLFELTEPFHDGLVPALVSDRHISRPQSPTRFEMARTLLSYNHGQAVVSICAVIAPHLFLQCTA